MGLVYTELYHDDFNRPNENPLDPPNWTERPAVPTNSDVLQILNRVCCSTIASSNGGDGTAQYNPVLPNDQYVECVIASLTPASIGLLNLYIRDTSIQSFMVPFWTVGIANLPNGTGYLDYWQAFIGPVGPAIPFDAGIYLNAPSGLFGPSLIQDRWLPGDKLTISIVGDYATGRVYVSKNGLVVSSIPQSASPLSLQTGKAGLQINQDLTAPPASLSISRWAVGSVALVPDNIIDIEFVKQVRGVATF